MMGDHIEALMHQYEERCDSEVDLSSKKSNTKETHSTMTRDFKIWSSVTIIVNFHNHIQYND